jgi:large subunit ribosomal protein L29
MKYADITGFSEKELVKKSKELRGQIFEARMKNALGQLANPMTIREMRRDVARYNTAMTAKVSGAPPAKKVAAPKAAPKASKAPKSKAKAKAKAGAKG